MANIFDQPKYIYAMPSGKGTSRCPYASCRSRNPSVRNALESEIQLIPQNNRTLAGSHPIQHCGYCDGIWWEEFLESGGRHWALLGFV